MSMEWGRGKQQESKQPADKKNGAGRGLSLSFVLCARSILFLKTTDPKFQTRESEQCRTPSCQYPFQET